MPLPDHQRHRIRKDVLSRQLDDETVLLDLASGTYFGLNEVGASVWELMQKEASVAEIREQLLATFDVEAQMLDRDLEQLISQLRGRGLIETVSAPGPQVTKDST